MDAAPFLPKLLPLLKRAMDEVADPECRQVCTRAYKTLLIAAGESSDAVIDENAESKRTDESTVRAQMTSMMTEISGASEADITAFLTSAEVQPYFEYICKLSTNALLAKNFDFETWKKSCATPYLALFFDGAEAPPRTSSRRRTPRTRRPRRCSSWRTRRARTCASATFPSRTVRSSCSTTPPCT